MRVLSTICGILMAIFGISLICTPIATFLSTGYFFAIMLLVTGVIGLIKGFSSHNYGIRFIFAVISTVLGIIMAIAPATRLIAEGMLLNLIAFWFILQGIIAIVLSVKAKQAGVKGWGWKLALGIVGLILGIYTTVHPMVLAVTLGILIGVYFIETGIGMIITSKDN